MTKGKTLRQRLVAAVLVLVMMLTSLIGTTFAWFTDEVTSAGNKIVSGSLKIDLRHEVKKDEWVSVKNNSTHLIFDYDNWEPGYTNIETLEIVSLGNLALQYRLSIELEDGTALLGENGENLADVIDVYTVYGNEAASSYDDITKTGSKWVHEGTLADVLRSPSSFIGGQLLPTGETLKGGEAATTAVRAQTVRVALHMQESAGNGYQGLSVGNIYVNLIATQWSYESDSFDNGYDNGATFPTFKGDYVATEKVELNADNTVKSEVNLSSKEGEVSATVPSGVLLEAGTDEVTLTVSSLDKTASNVQVKEDQVLNPLDVHVSGVAAGNTKPILVTVKELLAKGLNMGNYELYHVEDGSTVKMTYVQNSADLDAHNEFTYDPATGDVVMALCSFSEIAVVAETTAAWKGNFDYSWYDADATELTIANGDQLAGLSAIVGGMNGYTADSFKDKTVKLVADINLGDKEAENNPKIIFYPIGYYNSEGTYEKTNTAITSGLRNFEGTFDGNGNTISNFYQNTWEMKGDHDWYSPEEQYYRDGMGLFGRVYKGNVKNLTVSNFTSDGEIATTGVIAAYADFGATFENIAIFDCNPRVYNIGNGGIVGCVGWYTKAETDKKVTFKNITVDNSNKISALWGSYDVACGGIVGQYYPTSGQSSAGTPKNAGIHFENCHVSAQMDVYNDVCANYQYYAYRYTGMLIGSVRENLPADANGHVYPNMDGITASGCTVHFGTWNDYYYCEIIDNTTASYTHDYQMSRLTEIKAINGTTITYLDGTTGTVPTSGRANYVIVDYTKGHGTENATCYHFKDGAVWTHDMGGIQTGIDENGDGQDDLKEDKQHIYLEFNNLVTGYGWGVTSKGVDDLEGVTILDREVGDSKVKFDVQESIPEIKRDQTISIGELFKESNISDEKLKIIEGKVQVTVSPKIGTISTVGAVYESNANNWKEGTLTFSGFGEAIITITDYYFCIATTLEITVNDYDSVEKFETKFTGDFLYRVGNQNTVAIGSLFKAKDGVTVGTVSVTVEAVGGTAASGTYTNNATWTNGTIQFTGTGVVKVTITDNDYCTPTELTFEVVDAVNATTATSATKNNVVLLNDCGFSSLEVSGGYTLYGNGFTMTCSSDSYATDRTYAFVELKGGTLDNVQVVTPNFSHAIMYESNKTEGGNPSNTDSSGKTRYYNIRSAVLVSATSKITNSYISGGRAAIYATSGELTIQNSTIFGGAVANIQTEASSKLVLEDVTLIQKPIKATVNDKTKTVMGLSVVTMCDTNGVGSSITLKGYLHQYAWANSDYKQYVPSNAQSVVDEVLKNTDYIHSITYADGVARESVNLGFAYMPNGTSATNADNMNDTRSETEKNNTPYDKVTVSSVAVIYTYKNTNGTNDSVKTEPTYTANTQGIVIPNVQHNDINENRVFTTTYDSTKAQWKSTLKVDVDAGAYSFSFANLLAQKYGKNLSYTVKTEDGTVVDKNATITLNSAVSNVYILTITDDQIYDKNGALTGEKVEITYVFELLSTKTSLPAPTWTSKNLNGTPYIVVDSKDDDWNCAVPVLDGLKVKYWSKKQNKEIELDLATVVSAAGLSAGLQNGSNNTITITVADEYTLKITTTGFKTNDNGKPVVVTVDNNKKLYFTVSSSGNYVSTSTTERTPSISYTFTDANNSEPLTLSKSFNVVYDTYKSTQYNYTDFCNGTLTEAEDSGCLVEGTMITLADGSQKAVEDLKVGDMIMVFNHITGEYEAMPLIFNTHADVLEAQNYDVLYLQFANGKEVKIVQSHGFFDTTLMKYVYINYENYTDFVGHEFYAIDENGIEERVELTNAFVKNECVRIFCPVTYFHMNSFANGFLNTPNIPGDITGLVNYFEYDADLKYNEEAMQRDIETYGLYTYDDFSEYISEEAYNSSPAVYLKVAVGKGMITYEEIVDIIYWLLDGSLIQ